MNTVSIGMDPHKRSATIEVVAADETVLGGGRYSTDAAGYAAMLAGVRRWPERIWAIEGCRGVGWHSRRYSHHCPRLVLILIVNHVRTLAHRRGEGIFPVHLFWGMKPCLARGGMVALW